MNMNVLHTGKVIIFVALSVSASLSWANTSQDPINGQAATEQVAEVPSKDEDLEVIGVVGKRTLSYFRVKMEKAEMDFYDAYNALAQDHKFKVQCRRENRGASNIRIKVCYPQYVLERMAQETQEALSSGLPFPSLEDIEFAVKKERAESMKYVEKVVTENPKLLEKLLALNERKAKFEEAKLNK
jgi:hypothetical protein